MKNLLIIFTLLFTSVFFSSPSYAEWTKLFTSENGSDFYVDFTTIRQTDRYVYYWELRNLIKPDKWGGLSSKTLYELDCNTPVKDRSVSTKYYTQTMGKGTPTLTDNTTRKWNYSPPQSGTEFITKQVCNAVGK